MSMSFDFQKFSHAIVACSLMLVGFLLLSCGVPQSENDKLRSRPKLHSQEENQIASENAQSTDTSNGDQDEATSTKRDISSASTQISTDLTIHKTISSADAAFQVKDVELLRSSIESCMGPGMTIVEDSMIIESAPSDANANTDGRIRFLFPLKIKKGDDIIDYERINLVETTGGSRTSTAADAISDTYLRSLENIANVVAHNCNSGNDSCNCSTKTEAAALLKRCLPALDPKSAAVSSAAESMAKMCANGPGGMRIAIASFIASYAFASAR